MADATQENVRPGLVKLRIGTRLYSMTPQDIEEVKRITSPYDYEPATGADSAELSEALEKKVSECKALAAQVEAFRKDLSETSEELGKAQQRIVQLEAALPEEVTSGPADGGQSGTGEGDGAPKTENSPGGSQG